MQQPPLQLPPGRPKLKNPSINKYRLYVFTSDYSPKNTSIPILSPWLCRRKTMRIFTWFFTFLISFSIFAKTSTEVEVSKTFKVVLPFPILNKVEMPSLHSTLFHVTGNSDRNKSQILIVHNRPQTLANEFSVERYWKKSREQTKLFDIKEKNLGCTKETARRFFCSRDVAQDGKFISESIYWNTKNDLVLIRVTSLISFSETRNFLNKIKPIQNSRIPASRGSAK